MSTQGHPAPSFARLTKADLLKIEKGLKVELFDWLTARGGKPSSKGHMEIAVAGPGLLFVSFYVDATGPWLACRWDDVERATASLRGSVHGTERLNRHSGKWNWHSHEQRPDGVKHTQLVHVGRMVEMFKAALCHLGVEEPA